MTSLTDEWRSAAKQGATQHAPTSGHIVNNHVCLNDKMHRAPPLQTPEMEDDCAWATVAFSCELFSHHSIYFFIIVYVDRITLPGMMDVGST